MNTKLLLVSVVFHGKPQSIFVRVLDGNTVDQSLVNKLLSDLGCTQRGSTYTVG